MKEIEILIKEIGLNETETAVFNFLLNVPPQSASSIARNLNINRSSTYNLLTSLINRGVVQQTPVENTSYYSLRDVNHIIESIKYNKLDSIKNLSEIEENLKKLNRVPLGLASSPKFSIERGKNAYFKVFEQVRNVKCSLVAMIASREIQELIGDNPKFRIDMFNPDKPFKVLLGVPVNFGKIKYVRKKMKLLPEEFDLGFDFFVNEERVFIISVLEEMVITIESKVLTEGFRKYFKLAWVIFY